MLIKKIFNNNVVLVERESNNEVVIIGKGIAFQKKAGDIIDSSKIDQTFTSELQGVSDKLIHLLKKLPADRIELSDSIIKMAKRSIKSKFSNSIYITLTDHLDFAIERNEKGYMISNPLLWEVKKIYPEEFAVGIAAIHLIKKEIDICLPEDEAASIALHFVNAQQRIEEMSQVVENAQIIQTILNIVQYHYGVHLKTASINYNRFVLHLKFFVQRLINGELSNKKNNHLFEIIVEKYPKVYSCVEKINQYVYEIKQITLSESEKVYLMLHIERVTSR